MWAVKPQVARTPARAKRDTTLVLYNISDARHFRDGAFLLFCLRSNDTYLSLCQEFPYCLQNNSVEKVALLTDSFCVPERVLKIYRILEDFVDC